METKNLRLIGIMITVSLLLLIPFIAMQLTSEVIWTASDFLIAGVLLLGTGLLCELVLRNFKKRQQRLAICGGLLLVLALIWIELAVGLFGTPFAGS